MRLRHRVFVLPVFDGLKCSMNAILCRDVGVIGGDIQGTIRTKNVVLGGFYVFICLVKIGLKPVVQVS